MAVTIQNYDKMVEYFGDNTIDMDGDTFKGELYNSTHTFTQANTQRSDIVANALATNFGYTNPGQDLTTPTWVEGSGTVTFDAADQVWTASGGSIGPARHMVIYSDTASAPVDALMLNINFGQDETAGDGTDFRVNFNATGIFQI
jgi:hypothetical protein